MTSKELTVLFADLSGSTHLYQMQGDVRAHQAITQSLQCMKRAIEDNGGSLLRTVGDSALASFTSTDAACDAAIAIHREHARLGLSVRVGFHVGEVIPDAGDVYGNAVNLAARVAEFAEASEICMTGIAVAALSRRHRENAHFLDNVQFKGVTQPMPVFRVHWQADVAQTVIVSDQPEMKKHGSFLPLIFHYCDQQRILETGALSFGRSTDNDMVVDHESASRHHASVGLIGGRFLLSDTSTNGTYVLRPNSTPEFLRRESMPLSGSGIIGLGFNPDEEPSHRIHFCFDRSSSNATTDKSNVHDSL